MIIDTHAHLTDPSLLSQLDRVLAEASAAGVASMLAVATDLRTSQACIELAEQHSAVWASVGIHPNYCAAAQTGDMQAITELASHPRVRGGHRGNWARSPLDDSPWTRKSKTWRGMSSYREMSIDH